MEEWRDIKGYEGLYQVSNFGRVMRLDKVVHDIIKGSMRSRIFNGHIMKLLTNKYTNYVSVYISKDGHKTRYHVHRLVADAFIPNPDNLPCVNHKDENKANNCVDNLEWCTYQYNSAYKDCNRRSAEIRMPCSADVVVFAKHDLDSGMSSADIMRRYNLGKTTVNKIKYSKGIYGKILQEQ